MSIGQVTAIVIGAGSRGNTYATYAAEFPDKLKIVGVAEPRDFYRDKMAKEQSIPQENVYKSWESIAERDRFADIAIIATPDAMHVGPAIAMAAKGYHILLEKPLAPTWQGCQQIESAVKRNGKLFCVCHVLRYTAYTKKLKDLLDSGLIGDIVSIQHLEPVGYWHQAHSFVRGNFRNTTQSSFMLLQKSCHDIDWLYYIVGSDCKEVSSFGNLRYFTKANKPQGASDRCTDCSIEKDCPYSAVKIYVRQMAQSPKPYFGWPVDVLTCDLTVEGVMEALRTGDYGRCVYECDNDVVDHQVVNMLFENGVTVSFTMTAFTEANAGRRTRIFGTKGQIEGNSETIVHYDFLTEKSTEIGTDISDGSIVTGHGGGDFGIMRDFVEAVASDDGSKIISDLRDTMQSHQIVFAAEKARLEGIVVKLQ